MAKRGQYFTIDAFIALSVIATGLILVFSVSSYAPYSKQPEILSQEFVNTLAQTRIKEINDPFVLQQIRGGNITNADNTILQQAYEFKHYYRYNFSTWLLSNVSRSIVPSQFNFDVLIDGDTVYGRGTGKEDSELVLSSKRI